MYFVQVFYQYTRYRLSKEMYVRLYTDTLLAAGAANGLFVSPNITNLRVAVREGVNREDTLTFAAETCVIFKNGRSAFTGIRRAMSGRVSRRLRFFPRTAERMRVVFILPGSGVDLPEEASSIKTTRRRRRRALLMLSCCRQSCPPQEM